MPIIRRDDGIQFAIQTYREKLSVKSASLLKNEIRLLSENHGEFVRIFRINTKEVEAVFSRDPGFLLAESIWYFYGRPNDLIFVEALPDLRQAIVVVIKSKSVYLDARIPYDSIADEFATLLTGANQYDIYIVGDVPVSDTPHAGKFYFRAEQVSSFHRLDESLFNKLKPAEELELQPLELALRSEIFRERPTLKIGLLSAVLVIIIIFVYYEWIKEEAVVEPVVTPTVTAPKISPFKQALATPAPSKILQEFLVTLNLAMVAPGWEPVSMSFKSNQYVYRLSSIGGTLTTLRDWALAQNLTIKFIQGGVNLSIPSKIEDRVPRQQPESEQALVAELIDHLDTLLAGKQVALGNTRQLENIKETKLTINLRQISPNVVNLIGRRLQGLPVKLDSMQISIAQGVLSGTIVITVVGN